MSYDSHQNPELFDRDEPDLAADPDYEAWSERMWQESIASQDASYTVADWSRDLVPTLTGRK